MKQKEILLNTPFVNADSEYTVSTWNTPLRADAFELDDKTKVEKISHHIKEILEILGLDLTDDSLRETPNRVATMYVHE